MHVLDSMFQTLVYKILHGIWENLNGFCVGGVCAGSSLPSSCTLAGIVSFVALCNINQNLSTSEVRLLIIRLYQTHDP